MGQGRRVHESVQMEMRQVGGDAWPLAPAPLCWAPQLPASGWEPLRPPAGTHQERGSQLCPWEVGAPCRGAEGRSPGSSAVQADSSPRPEGVLVWRQRKRWELVVGRFVFMFSEPDGTGGIWSLQGRDPGPAVPTMPAAPALRRARGEQPPAPLHSGGRAGRRHPSCWVTLGKSLPALGLGLCWL